MSADGSGGHLLVLADSLAFHGPRQPEAVRHEGLYPNVAAQALGLRADLVARMGWTARDAWWALTKDPVVWSVLLPRAEAVLIGVGGMDQLPASVPTYLREGIAYTRPGPVRRAVRRGYRRAHPGLVRATGGRMLTLPVHATSHYLTRVVEGIRHFRPDLPFVRIAPPPWSSPQHPVDGSHAPALAAARAWAVRTGVPLVEVEDVVRAGLAAGTANPDGLHWGWDTHAEVGARVAAAFARQEVGPS